MMGEDGLPGVNGLRVGTLKVPFSPNSKQPI